MRFDFLGEGRGSGLEEIKVPYVDTAVAIGLVDDGPSCPK